MEHVDLHNVPTTKHAMADSRTVEHPTAFALVIHRASAFVALMRFVSVQQLAIMTETAIVVVFVPRRHVVRRHPRTSLGYVFLENATILLVNSLYCPRCSIQIREVVLRLMV